MRTDVEVGGKQVVAVVLADVATSLTYPLARVHSAIRDGEYGEVRVTKDFLIPGLTTTTVMRNVNGKRRKCEVIKASTLDQWNLDQLIAGMYITAQSICTVKMEVAIAINRKHHCSTSATKQYNEPCMQTLCHVAKAKHL